MPELLSNNMVVVYWKELVPKFWSSYRSLKQRIDTDAQKGYGLRVVQKGLGKGNRLLIDYDSLPKRYQEQLKDPRIPDHFLLPYYQVDRETTDYYHNFKYPDGTYLLPETIEQLIVDASVLKTILRVEAKRTHERITLNGSLRGINKTLFEDLYLKDSNDKDFNDHLFQNYGVKHTLNTTYKHFSKQLKAFKAHSYYGIIKDPEGNSKSNAKKRNERVDQLLRNLFAGRKTKPTATEVANEYEAFLAGYIDIVNVKTGEVYNPAEYSKIGHRTITRFLASWDSKIGTDAKRSGNRQKLINDKIPHYSFERPVLAGSLISIDDRQPPFEYEKGKRMWWYIGIDVASEAIIAWAYGKTKEELILNFYRNLVENYAKWNIKLPAELECESHLNSSFTDSFLADGAMFERVTMYRNNARSKIIERFFEELRYRFEKNHIGWLARPTAKAEANQIGPAPKEIIPFDKLVQQSLGDIVKWNNMPKKGTEVSRFDYFMQHQNPNLVPTNYKSFSQILGVSRKTSCNAGIVSLNKGEWLLGDNGKIATGENLVRLLRLAEGKVIDVRFFRTNKGDVFKALAYDKNSQRYLCELLPKPRGMRGFKEKTPEHEANELLLAKYAGTVNAYMLTQKNTIEEVTVINNKPETVSDSFSIDEFDIFIPDTSEPTHVEMPTEEYDFENEYFDPNKALNNL